MNALVLSGGGAKGAYQIGVWKALRQLEYKFDIVTGSSIGAINGALIVQGDYLKANYMWRKFDSQKIFNNIKTPRDIIASGLSGGLDPVELEKLLKKVIKPSKIRKSKINYGLVTVEFPKMKPINLTKEKIKEEEIIDYILASSSCFPIFKMRKIDNKTYIDGGYADNLPINLAIKMGATKVIAVDLKALGLTKKQTEKVEITYIKPRKNLSPLTELEKDINEKNMRYGYYDTLIVFNKLEGKKYYFKKLELEKNYKKHKETFIALINQIINQKVEYELISNKLTKTLINKKNIIKEFNQIVEQTAELLDLDDSIKYTSHTLNKQILKNKQNNHKLNHVVELLNQNIKSKKIIKYLNTKELFSAIYIYTIERRV